MYAKSVIIIGFICGIFAMVLLSYASFISNNTIYTKEVQISTVMCADNSGISHYNTHIIGENTVTCKNGAIFELDKKSEELKGNDNDSIKQKIRNTMITNGIIIFLVCYGITIICFIYK